MVPVQFPHSRGEGLEKQGGDWPAWGHRAEGHSAGTEFSAPDCLFSPRSDWGLGQPPVYMKASVYQRVTASRAMRMVFHCVLPSCLLFVWQRFCGGINEINDFDFSKWKKHYILYRAWLLSGLRVYENKLMLFPLSCFSENSRRPGVGQAGHVWVCVSMLFLVCRCAGWSLDPAVLTLQAFPWDRMRHVPRISGILWIDLLSCHQPTPWIFL